MSGTPQQITVGHRIAALKAEAADERLAASARAAPAGASIRRALGRRLISIGAAIAQGRVADDPCTDTAGAQRA